MFHLAKQKPKPLKITAACGCDIGLVRSNNEDNLYFNGIVLAPDNRGLDGVLYYCSKSSVPVHFGVFDGMGGEAYGELASHLAATEIRNLPGSASEQALVDALLRANEEICETARSRNCKRIGTTAAILTIHDEQACITNIGDSKIYRFRAGTLEQLSTDHTDEVMMGQHGVTGRKPRLSQHLGIEPDEMVIEPALRTEPLLAGDRYVICSDGLSDLVTETEIASILAVKRPSLGEHVNNLISLALHRGGKDNVTVILVAID